MGIINSLSHPISLSTLEKISNNLKKLQHFAEYNNIDLYVMIPPAKEDVYRDKLIGVFANLNNDNNVIDSLKDYIMQKNKIEIVYPRDIYRKNYKDFTHFKTDHHWTEFGAFLGYQELTKKLLKKYPDITPLKESDFNVFYKDRPRYGNFKNLFDRPFYIGSNCDSLGIKTLCPLQYKYKYYDHKNRKKLKVEYGPMAMSRITHYEPGISKNVTLLGNSYGGFLMEFLPYNFQNVQFLRVNNNEKGVSIVYDMKRFEKHILDFHTDILIFYLASSYFHDFTNLYKD